jgi:hypothetical protein
MNYGPTLRGIISACLLLLPFSPLLSKPDRPKPDLLFIENKVAKVGIDRSMGASITWLSWEGNPENTINIHDPGRLLQQSYYAGKTLDRQADGQAKSWSPWSWNPIQGGGVNSWAQVKSFRRIGAGRLYSKTIPKLWDMPDEEAKAEMEQDTEFVRGMPNVVMVRNRLTCKRAKDDKWGDAVPRHQELPACYFTSRFRNVEMYLGGGKWESVKQPPGPPWGKAEPPLNIMGCFADDGQGIVVFCPASDLHWNFGPHEKYDPGAKPTDDSCMHLAPIGVAKLGPQSILEYSYWIIVGEKSAIEPRLETLLTKHKDEKLKVTDPD